MKLKRILAIVGVVILVALYLSTIVFAIIDSDYSKGLFMASIYASVIIPVMIYIYTVIYKVAKKNEAENEN
ncbi:MAG: hypothetical protein IKL73_02030 [Lachnospiraceae bacterium]|nr:hypothetical protein [Lachnospiraceae bacterium]